MKKLIFLTSIMLLVILGACQQGYSPINYGKDACHHCKMTIVDPRFAAEIVTAKGKPFKFDDIICMKQYLGENKNQMENAQLYVAGYLHPDKPLINATTAVYIKSTFFKSPMSGHLGAFSNQDEAQKLKDSLNLPTIAWTDITE